MRRVIPLLLLIPLLGCGLSVSEPTEAISLDFAWSPGEETAQIVSSGPGNLEIIGSMNLCTLDMDIAAVLESADAGTLSVSVSVNTHGAVCTTRGDWLEYKLQIGNVPPGDYRLLVRHLADRNDRLFLWQVVDEVVRVTN